MKTQIIRPKTVGYGLQDADITMLINSKVDRNGRLVGRVGFASTSASSNNPNTWNGRSGYKRGVCSGFSYNGLQIALTRNSQTGANFFFDSAEAGVPNGGVAVAPNFGQVLVGTEYPLDRDHGADVAKGFIIASRYGPKRFPRFALDQSGQHNNGGGLVGGRAYSTVAYHRNAGTPKALDPADASATAGAPLFNTTNYNWLDGQCSVGYFVVYGFRDEAGNLFIGAPSGRLVIQNTNAVGTKRCPTFRIPLHYDIFKNSGNDRLKFLVQVYRTVTAKADPSGAIPDPGSEAYMIAEFNPSSTDVTNRYADFDDLVPDSLVGPPLYTNSTQEGAVSGRERPPISKDIAYWQDCAWYSNTRPQNRLVMSLLGTTPNGSTAGTAGAKGLDVGDIIMCGGIAMKAVDQIANETNATDFAIFKSTITDPVLRSIRATERFVYRHNTYANTTLNASGKIPAYAHNLSNPDDAYGKILFQEIECGDESGLWLGLSRVDTPTAVLPDPSYHTLKAVSQIATNAGPTTITFTVLAGHGVVAGDWIYVGYYNRHSETGATKVRPGGYSVASVTATTIVCSVDTTVYTPTASQTDAAADMAYLHKVESGGLSSPAGGWPKWSRNRVFYSAIGEPDGVPLLNYVDVGSNRDQILRIVPLGQSLFVFKSEEGVFQISGSYGNYSVDSFDNTCKCLAPDSISRLGSKIILIASSGLVELTQNGARVLHPIDNPLIRGLVLNQQTGSMSANPEFVIVSAASETTGEYYAMNQYKEPSSIGFTTSNIPFIMYDDESGNISAVHARSCGSTYSGTVTYTGTQMLCDLVSYTGKAFAGSSIFDSRSSDAVMLWVTQANNNDSSKYTPKILSNFNYLGHDYASSYSFVERNCDGQSTFSGNLFSVDSANKYILITDTAALRCIEVGDSIESSANPGKFLVVSAITAVMAYTQITFESEPDVTTSVMSAWGTGDSFTVRKAIDHGILLGKISPAGEDSAHDFSAVRLIAGSQASFGKILLTFKTDLNGALNPTAPTTGDITSAVAVYVYGYGDQQRLTLGVWPMNETVPNAISNTRTLPDQSIPRVYRKGGYIVIGLTHAGGGELMDIRGLTLQYTASSPTAIQRDNAG